LPLIALLFLPIALGAGKLYEWADPAAVAHDPILRHKSLYLNVPFFFGRAVVYFAAWLAFAYFLNRWSLEQDATAGRSIPRKLQLLSSAGLVVYGLTVTFASIDWAMSLEPHWFSTMYGVLFIAGQGLSAFAFIVVMMVLLSERAPLAGYVAPSHYHDLGKLMLAFVMFWAYVSFSQYLIIWAGNLPEEIPWYLRRLQGGWGWIALAILLFHFVLPFLMLLPASANRNPRVLGAVAALLVLMRLVEMFWLTQPAFSDGRFRLHWMDFLAPIGIGGLWLFVFSWQLGKRPLLPVNDPELRQALALD
jgi:MFS family permease